MKNYSVTRSVPFAEILNFRPDAFLFARRGLDPYTPDEIFEIMNSPEVKRHLGDDVTKILAASHLKRDLGEEHGGEEARLYVTLNTHYFRAIDDNHTDWKVLFYNPQVKNKYRLDAVHPHMEGWHWVEYGRYLNDCIEIYRHIECDLCPKRGKRCLLEHLNFAGDEVFSITDEIEDIDEFAEAIAPADAWPFIMPCTRPDASAFLLRQDENPTLDARDEWIEKHSFLKTNPDEVNTDSYKILDRIIDDLKGTEICSHKFVNPADTLPSYVENVHLNHRLRPPRYIVFDGTKPLNQENS